jgi:hypothetical protein
VPNCKCFLVTEAERKHVRRRASLVAVACFLPGRAKDLSAPLIYMYITLFIALDTKPQDKRFRTEWQPVTGRCRLLSASSAVQFGATLQCSTLQHTAVLFLHKTLNTQPAAVGANTVNTLPYSSKFTRLLRRDCLRAGSPHSLRFQ